MPERTAAAAFRRFLGTTNRSASCVTRAVAGHDCVRPDDLRTHRLLFGSEDGVEVSARGERLRLRCKLYFRIDRVDEGWDVFRTGYDFSITDPGQREIAAYHWHPGGAAPEFPHLHLLAGAGTLRPDVRAAHFPTGEVSLSDFLLLDIRDFGVRPLRPDYEELLGASQEA